MPYTPSVGNVTSDLDTAWRGISGSLVVADLRSDGSVSCEGYWAPVGYVVANLEGDYTPPDGDVIGDAGWMCSFAGEGFKPAPPAPDPAGTQSGIGIRWGGGSTARAKVAAGWGVAEQENVSRAMPWGEAAQEKGRLDVPWGAHAEEDSSIDVPFGDLESDRAKVAAPWIMPSRAKAGLVVPWGGLRQGGRFLDSGWIHPGRGDLFLVVPWGDLEPDGRFLDSGWIRPGRGDVFNTQLWGPENYARICLQDYIPPVGYVIGNVHEVPPGNILAIDNHAEDIRCTHREPSWFIQAPSGYVQPFEHPGNPYWPITPVILIMSNTTIITQPGGDTVYCTGAEVSIDLDSWGWSFRAELLRDSDFALVDPTISGPVEILLTINGHQWNAIVERYSHSERHPRRGYTIYGRSFAAELSADYSSVVSYIETALRTAAQLADQELPLSGWTLNWNVPDWLVPIGAWSYTDLSPLAAIREIAGAVGAVVQASRVGRTLDVVSRYNGNPWDWSGATPDRVITGAHTTTPSGDYKSSPLTNNVYVAGMEGGGVLTRVKRSGSAGDIDASMVTHRMLTHVDAGRERGRVELAGTGAREIVQIPAPVVVGDDSALLLPGLIIQHTPRNQASWQGQIVGLRVASRGIKAVQTATVERYRDD